MRCYFSILVLACFLVPFLCLVLFWSDVCKKRIRCGLSWVRQGSKAAVGRWCLLHHPPTHAFRAVCTTSPLVLLCHKYASVLLCATSKYAAHCASSHLSPPSPSPRTFRRPRGRRPGSARGLLQRPGKLLEIQTSLDLFQRKDETE